MPAFADVCFQVFCVLIKQNGYEKKTQRRQRALASSCTTGRQIWEKRKLEKRRKSQSSDQRKNRNRLSRHALTQCLSIVIASWSKTALRVKLHTS